MTSPQISPPLLDVLYELSLNQHVPNAAVLDEFVARYPEYAEALTAFAIELAVDVLSENSSGEEPLESVPAGDTSPAVSRAMSRYQNRLHAIKRGESKAPTGSSMASGVTNPFLTLDKTAFRGLAKRLHANTLFVAKLRDREIDPTTMSEGFRRRVSQELNAPLDLVVAHFAARQQPESWTQLYKANDKPHVGLGQSFTDAVRNSGLDAEQRRYLLSL